MGELIPGPWEDPLLDDYPLSADDIKPDPPGLSICTQCVFFLDPRPWWKKLFFKVPASVPVCTKTRMRQLVHPVTGRNSYAWPGEILYATTEEVPYRSCQSINLTGNCKKFEPKVTYK